MDEVTQRGDVLVVMSEVHAGLQDDIPNSVSIILLTFPLYMSQMIQRDCSSMYCCWKEASFPPRRPAVTERSSPQPISSLSHRAVCSFPLRLYPSDALSSYTARSIALSPFFGCFINFLLLLLLLPFSVLLSSHAPMN